MNSQNIQYLLCLFIIYQAAIDFVPNIIFDRLYQYMLSKLNYYIKNGFVPIFDDSTFSMKIFKKMAKIQVSPLALFW